MVLLTEMYRNPVLRILSMGLNVSMLTGGGPESNK